MSVKQISVFLDDRPGALAALAEVLKDNDIDMRAVSVADARDFGIVRMIVDDNAAAVAVMEDAGYVCSLLDVLAVGVEDSPGGFCAVLRALGDMDVNINYSYTMTTHNKDKAFLIARVSDIGRASDELEAGGWECLKEADIPNV